MESPSFQRQAETVRREAEQGTLREFRWHNQRAEKFKEASELYAQAGLMEQAYQAWWDAQLWFTATGGLGAYDKDEPYFRPLATLVAEPDQNGETETAAQEQRVIHVGDPNDLNDEARAYFDRRLDESNPPLIQARYTDFLFDQGFHEQRAPRARFEYARLAVTAYLEVAQGALGDPELALEASSYLLRAAFIARGMNSVDDLIPRVRAVVVASLNTLRTERRYRYTIELTRALLTLGNAVEEADLRLAEEALREGAAVEREAGRYFAERLFLAALEQRADHSKDAVGRDRVRREIAESYEADAAARSNTSHLAAAALLEDAARIYQTLRMHGKVGQILRQIKQEYQAGEGEYGRIEVQGELPIARIARISAPDVEPDDPHDILTGRLTDLHPNTVVERLFVNDSFADEVDALVAAQRQRERDEAARETGE